MRIWRRRWWKRNSCWQCDILHLCLVKVNWKCLWDCCMTSGWAVQPRCPELSWQALLSLWQCLDYLTKWSHTIFYWIEFCHWASQLTVIRYMHACVSESGSWSYYNVNTNICNWDQLSFLFIFLSFILVTSYIFFSVYLCVEFIYNALGLNPV